jgi:hypothetical protein
METKFDMNDWRRISGELRNKYPELTSADLYWGRVSREDLLQMISSKLGKTQKDLMSEIDSF